MVRARTGRGRSGVSSPERIVAVRPVLPPDHGHSALTPYCPWARVPTRHRLWWRSPARPFDAVCYQVSPPVASGSAAGRRCVEGSSRRSRCRDQRHGDPTGQENGLPHWTREDSVRIPRRSSSSIDLVGGARRPALLTRMSIKPFRTGSDPAAVDHSPPTASPPCRSESASHRHRRVAEPGGDPFGRGAVDVGGPRTRAPSAHRSGPIPSRTPILLRSRPRPCRARRCGFGPVLPSGPACQLPSAGGQSCPGSAMVDRYPSSAR